MIARFITHDEVKTGDRMVGGIVVSQRYSASGKSVRYTFRSIATGEVKEWPWESTLACTAIFEPPAGLLAWGHGGCTGTFAYHERLKAADVYACPECGQHRVDFDDPEAHKRQMAELAGALVDRADEVEHDIHWRTGQPAIGCPACEAVDPGTWRERYADTDRSQA